ncbi:MAG: hypothetical protein ACREJO_17330 [Phycisphaerales bacterium]
MNPVVITLIAGFSIAAAQPPAGPPPATTRRPPGNGTDAAKPTPVPLDAATVWKAAVGAYRDTRIAERVTINIKPADQPLRTSDFTIRFDPGTPPTGAAPATEKNSATDRTNRSVLFELGPLRAHASRGVLTIWSTQHASTYFQSDYTGEFTSEKLEAALPPVPAPQLAAAAGLPADGPMNLASYLPAVRWAEASVPMDDPAARITMPGQGSNGTVQWLQDQRTGRMTRFVANMKSPAVKLELSCVGIDPGDPAAWKPDLSGRKRVTSVSELAHKPEPPKTDPAKLADPSKPADSTPAAPSSTPPPTPPPATKP